MKALSKLLILLILPVSFSCTSSDSTSNNKASSSNKGTNEQCKLGTDASTWDAIHKVIFDGNGCIGCHDNTISKGDLDLSKGVAHKNIFNILSKRDLKEPWKILFPGDQDKSLLYLKVEAKTLGKQLAEGMGKPMPTGDLTAITKDQLEALRLWIRAGAPEKGVVEGTEKLLKCGLKKDFDPNKIPPLEPPKKGEGIQVIAGPWNVKAESEDEVCFGTYYDFSKDKEAVPDWARVECKNRDGSKATCIALNGNILAQDPQSHHSINSVYVGKSKWDDPAWGPWVCRGGKNAGKSCNPSKNGVSVDDGGADCGTRSVCGTKTKSSTLCINFGPNDLRQSNLPLNGSQEPISDEPFAKGVYRTIPIKGIVIWNSHGFNLSTKDASLEQYTNIKLAKPEERKYLKKSIFDARSILSMRVPPFEQQEICRSFSLPKNAYLVDLGSHVHKRGVLFRVWAPPNDPSCTPKNKCKPSEAKPIYTSGIYDDPVQLFFKEPIAHTSDDRKMRTYKYCGVFDNGFKDQKTIKRFSKSSGPYNCLKQDTRCIGGPKHNTVCAGDNSKCESKAGAGDGDCDACLLQGGFTTEDEMFILLGSYYIKAP